MLLNMLTVWLILINLVGFIQMYVDKQRARKDKWRIPEKQLFLVALVGGSVGSIFGMYIFRHKTKHKSFVFGMPSILFLQVTAVVLACCFLN
jgi:uncharacterized membrane protein YsdA (DUF1294 family)